MSFPNDVNFTYTAPVKPKEQVGGTHYSRLGIEPIQFIETNGLGYHEGNVIKYVSRWRNKNGIEDLKKAKWYIERLLELETSTPEPTFEEPVQFKPGLAPRVADFLDDEDVEESYPGAGN